MYSNIPFQYIKVYHVRFPLGRQKSIGLVSVSFGFIANVKMRLCSHLLKIPEQLRSGSIALHVISYNRLGQRFGAAWFSNYKQRNPEFNAHYHHKHILT